MRSVRVCFVMLLALALSPATSRAISSPFVTASGSRLQINGQPWRAIGVNLWDMDAAAALGNLKSSTPVNLAACNYQHSDLDTYLDTSFNEIATLTHATAVRTFGFLESYTNGGRDWTTTDKLLMYARKYNIRIIPVLGDQYGACNGPIHGKTTSWYHCPTVGCTPGYKQTDWFDTSYRQYAVDVATRYKDDPTIAFWQLMNEAASVPDPTTDVIDQTALVDFARDITTEIKRVDPNHLVNLGTIGGGGTWMGYGNQLSFYGALLDCGPAGACTDIAENHLYDDAMPLPGVPMNSTVRAKLMTWDALGNETLKKTSGALGADGNWANLTSSIPPSAVRWGIRFELPPSGQWSAQIDDAEEQTPTNVDTQSFETGVEGWTSTQATLSTSATHPRTGLQSLHVDGPAHASATHVDVIAPPPAGSTTSVQAYARLTFNGPAVQRLTYWPTGKSSEPGAGIADYMHTAIVDNGKPFFMGEVGIRALIPGASPSGYAPSPPGYKPEQIAQHTDLRKDYCTGGATANQITVAQRAQIFDSMMALQLDADHGSSGFLVWDWKDPALTNARSTAKPVDPTWNCYSIGPGDPATAVLMRYADQLPAIPIPAAPLPV